MVALLSSQVLFPRRLDAGLPGIIAGTIFSGMGLDVFLVHFGDIAEQVASGVDRVVTDASHLSPEAREIVLEFGELHVGFGLYLLEHDHALVADLLLVLLVFGHLVPYEVGTHVERGSQEQGVELFHLPRSDQDVVGHLVADNYLSVTVVDYSPGRVDDVVDHRIVRRIDLVLVVDDLDVEQFAEDDGGGHHQSYQKDAAPVVTFCRHSSAGSPEGWTPGNWPAMTGRTCFP